VNIVPLVEITVASGKLTKEQQLRMAEAIQKTMLKEFEEMTGRTPGSYVLIREVDNDLWLVSKSST
jgi:phenylpyruvate tautomerase PptA (4-oxalocrotonate tautomerase family)